MVKVNKAIITTVTAGVLAGTISSAQLTTPSNEANHTNTTQKKNTSAATEHIAPKILNVGDSRTVGMYYSENLKKYNNTVDVEDAKGNYWFAKVGQGFNWFKNNIENIRNRAQNCNVIVINLGVNDLAMSGSSQVTAQKYITYLNSLADEWAKQGKSVFFSSSNPVGPQYRGYHVFNQKIDNFNKLMKEGLSSNITFIDTNSYIKDKLKAKDFDSAGLHYVSSINRDIHRYIETQISRKLEKSRNNNLAWSLQGQKDKSL